MFSVCSELFLALKFHISAEDLYSFMCFGVYPGKKKHASTISAMPTTTTIHNNTNNSDGNADNDNYNNDNDNYNNDNSNNKNTKLI